LIEKLLLHTRISVYRPSRTMRWLQLLPAT